MRKYIDAELASGAVKDLFKGFIDDGDEVVGVVDANKVVQAVLFALPPAENPTSHGTWLDDSGEGDAAVCSVCGECFDTTESELEWRKGFELFKRFYRFCPSCGARMDLEEKDAQE